MHIGVTPTQYGDGIISEWAYAANPFQPLLINYFESRNCSYLLFQNSQVALWFSQKRNQQRSQTTQAGDSRILDFRP